MRGSVANSSIYSTITESVHEASQLGSVSAMSIADTQRMLERGGNSALMQPVKQKEKKKGGDAEAEAEKTIKGLEREILER